jgi:hypothetical protein
MSINIAPPELPLYVVHIIFVKVLLVREEGERLLYIMKTPAEKKKKYIIEKN